ncbi:MAG: hypothetical protein JWO31_4125, partial [Phycisphaerales bacterium]|nr:hypothetical protein [Phycisphaerales bacterium]
MDLSKLPRLSSSARPPAGDPNAATAPADDGPAPEVPPPRYRVDRDVAAAPGDFLDVLLAVGVGLLFMFMGQGYGRHLLGRTDVYPPITGTGFVWSAPHPKAGQPIAPEELSPENKATYDAQVTGRRMGIVSESSLFLSGVGL